MNAFWSMALSMETIYGKCRHSERKTLMVNKGSYLVNGKFLAVDDFLVSSNGQFIAYMQADNNFVLYHADPTASTPTPDWSRPYWSSGTVLGLSSCYATLQSTG